MQGDVPYVLPDPSIGEMFECALDPYIGRRVKGEPWRRVLNGQVLPPSHADRPPPLPSVSQVRIVGARQ
jgi:hypothetical protein